MEAPSTDFDVLCSGFPPDHEQSSISPLTESIDQEHQIHVHVPNGQITDSIIDTCGTNVECSISPHEDYCLASNTTTSTTTLSTPSGMDNVWVTEDKNINDAKPTEYLILPGHTPLSHGQTHLEPPLLIIGNAPNTNTYEVNVLLDKGEAKQGIIKLGSALNEKNILQIDNEGKLIIQNSLVNPHLNSMITSCVAPDSDEERAQCGPQTVFYSCDYDGCEKCFSSQGHLRYHQMMHTGQKSLKCPHPGCDRKFAWPAHLKYHTMTHRGERPYCCVVKDCSKSFYTAQRLEVHLRTHTGERPFVCHHANCTKSFSTAGNLKNHLRIHTGEKPFPCDFTGCKKTFAEYSSLKKHKIVHSGEKPFSCQVCGRNFSQSGSRNVHMKKHHPTSNLIPTPLENNLHEKLLVLNTSENFQFQDNIVTIATEDVGPRDSLQSHVEDANSLKKPPSIQDADHAANVVVLTQPQELVSMATSLSEGTPQTPEEIVSNTILDNSNLHKRKSLSLKNKLI